LFGFHQLWHEDLFLVLPTEGTLRLLVSPNDGLSIGSVLYSICILLIWNLVGFIWAQRSYTRHVLMRVGEGGGINGEI
jgi:fluoroquinolone transport system permease protein